jgi:hypothetical protein
MTANTNLERRLAEHYASEPQLRAPDRVLHAALASIETTKQRRDLLAPWRSRTMSSYTKAAIAAVLIALATVGLLLLGNTAPQPVPERLSWTPERYSEDWPAPPRSVPPSGTPDVPLVRGDNTRWDPEVRAWEGLEYVDPVGDAGPGVTPWLDIREVQLSAGTGIASYSIELLGGVPLPPTDPRSRWIAYGIVIDTDGDGIADERIGIDNMPDGDHRAWSTDLLTGLTKWKAGPGYGDVYDDGAAGGSLGLDTWYPSAVEEIDHAVLRYSGGSGRFYGWASMIEDGRVVATDYAPDVGWLVQPVDPGLPLIGTTWIIERELQGGSMIVMMWLIFTSDGELQLELCQRGNATVQVTQDTIRVTDMALTGDPCGAEVTEMESDVLAVLTGDEVSYVVDAGVLDLRAGSNVLRFVGSPDPPPGP